MKTLVASLLLLASPLSLQAATSLWIELPDPTTTSVPFSVTVAAMNGSSIDASYAGTVHFTSTDSSATLPADYTFVPSDGGMHVFTVTMGRAGDGPDAKTHTVTVTDTANATITGVDVTVVHWNGSLVRRFSLSAPNVVDRNVPFPVEVRAMNESWADVPGYTGTIHFVASRGEIVPADYTFTSADAGRHTFMVTATKGDYSLIDVHDVSDTTVSATPVETTQVVCPELVATATNSGPMCQGGAAILFGSANLPVIDYWWISTVGHPPLFESHEQNPIARGAYTYVLTVRQANDCTATARTTVTVHQPEVPQVSLSSTTLCLPATLTATLTNAASYSDVHWTVDHGTILSGQGTDSIEVQPDAGSTSVYLEIDATESASGCRAYRVIGEVPVNATPSAEITTAAAICMQASSTASVPDAGSGAAYHWELQNGSISRGQGTRSIDYTPSGTGTVKLTASVANGSCQATDTVFVTVNGPTASVGGEFLLCGDLPAAIPVSLAGTPPFRIVWSDGVVQENIGGTTATRSVPAAGSYWITVVADSHCTGVAAGTATVTAGTIPAINGQPQSTSVRPGGSASLSVAASGGALLYRWYEGATGNRSKLVSIETDPVFVTPPLTRTTSYWVEVQNDCGLAVSRTATVTVSTAPPKRRVVRH